MDKTMRGYRQIPVYLKYLINTLLLVALLVVGNHLISSGAVNRAQKAVILQIGIYALLAVSLNVATGYLGQLPLGHAGFMAVGGYAAALIDQAGLKGFQVGGAAISAKHAGFAVNVGGATAEDVKSLLSQVSDIVFEKFQIRLEPEVRIW